MLAIDELQGQHVLQMCDIPKKDAANMRFIGLRGERR